MSTWADSSSWSPPAQRSPARHQADCQKRPAWGFLLNWCNQYLVPKQCCGYPLSIVPPFMKHIMCRFSKIQSQATTQYEETWSTSPSQMRSLWLFSIVKCATKGCETHDLSFLVKSIHSLGSLKSPQRTFLKCDHCGYSLLSRVPQVVKQIQHVADGQLETGLS